MTLKRKITLTLKKPIILHFSEILHFNEKISSKFDDLLGVFTYQVFHLAKKKPLRVYK